VRSEILKLRHKNQESTVTELDQCPAKWPSVRIASPVVQSDLVINTPKKLAGSYTFVPETKV
jgi:hypothetical protein